MSDCGRWVDWRHGLLRAVVLELGPVLHLSNVALVRLCCSIGLCGPVQDCLVVVFVFVVCLFV